MSLPFRLTDEQVAEMLGMSVKTLKRNVTRDPDSLPPFLPKKKGHVWVAEVVLAWFEKRMSRPVIFKIEFVSSESSSPVNLNSAPRMGSLAEDLMSSLRGGARQ